MSFMKTARWILLLSLLLFLASCSTTSRRGGATLSQAAEQAKKKQEPKEQEEDEPRREPEKPRIQREKEEEPLVLGEPVEDEEEDLEPDAIAVATLTTTSDGLPGVETETTDEGPKRQHLTIQGGYSTFGGAEIESSKGMSISVASYVDPQVRLALGLYVAELNGGNSPKVEGALKDFTELGIDFSGRFYVTPDHTFMGLYFLAGMRAGLMLWDYASDLVVVDEHGNEDTVKRDFLPIGQPYVGAGLSLLQTGRVHLGANISTGFRFYSDTTHQGFENDLFPVVGFARIALEGSLFIF